MLREIRLHRDMRKPGCRGCSAGGWRGRGGAGSDEQGHGDDERQERAEHLIVSKKHAEMVMCAHSATPSHAVLQVREQVLLPIRSHSTDILLSAQHPHKPVTLEASALSVPAQAAGV